MSRRRETLISTQVLELSKSMIKMSQFTMTVLFLKEVLRLAERTDIGCATTLQLNWIYAVAIFNDARSPAEMEAAIPYTSVSTPSTRRLLDGVMAAPVSLA